MISSNLIDKAAPTARKYPEMSFKDDGGAFVSPSMIYWKSRREGRSYGYGTFRLHKALKKHLI